MRTKQRFRLHVSRFTFREKPSKAAVLLATKVVGQLTSAAAYMQRTCFS